MKIQRIAVAAAAALLLYWGHRQFGWPGVAAVVGGLLMWLLLHFTRVMTVMQRAARRPIGHVDSAVMLNARLQTGMSLLQVVGLARGLGELTTPESEEPQGYRWTDPGGTRVQAVFAAGRLRQWQLVRPQPDAVDAAP